MNKNNRVKVIPQILGMLLCLALIQAACAQPGNPDKESTFGNVTSENVTDENVTDDNISGENVTVQAISKLEVQTSSLSDTVEAGKEYEYMVKIKNVADKDITIDPKVIKYNSNYCFNDDAIEISTPSTIKAGEITTMTIKVHVPENATVSDTYNGYIDMGVDGNVNDGSTPQIGLYFTIDEEPTVPFVKAFNTTTTDPITIEVSCSEYDSMGLRVSPQKEEPDVELRLTRDSIPVNMTLVKSVESGYITANSYPKWAIENGNIYQESGNSYVEIHKVPGAIGNWKLTILPKNVNSFTYSVTVGDDYLTK